MVFSMCQRIALVSAVVFSGGLVVFGQASADDPAQGSLRIHHALYGEISAPAGKPAADRAMDTTAQSSVSSLPMSPGEKFRFFLNKSFLSINPYVISLFSGALGEWVDDDHGRVSSTGDYLADSLTRAARSHAFRATANFFNKFLYPVAFRQDPRYHRSDRITVGGKISYALSRLVITRGDGGGDQFNASLILGGLTTAAISNAWERRERKNVPDSLRRFGIYMGLNALTNIIREFIGGQ